MDRTASVTAASPVGLDRLPRHFPYLLRVARQTLAARYSQIDPDDVVQDVLLRVVRRWPLLRFDDDRARDAQRQAPRWVDAELDLMFSPRPTALDGLMADEWKRRCAAALRELRAGDRRVVVGRVVESLSYQDLAARTGHVTADAARKATGRALGRLRTRLTAG
jgi:DNA-directed RNA polymerase specialized sigma24 family protein